MRPNLTLVLVVAGSAAFATARSQESPSFRLNEGVLNAGGRPENGVVAISASFRIELDALGDAVSPIEALGATLAHVPGFVAAYPPPGEVTSLRFDDHVTLRWDPERSAGNYNLYRDTLGALAAPGYGACARTSISGTTTTDTVPVPSASGFFYLVTVENRLADEGTKGYRSDGTERTGTVCP
jgi:hypothetical protein